MQSRNNASCRWAHARVIFSPPPFRVSIRGYGMEAIDTTRGYVMQQGSKERHTVSIPDEHECLLGGVGTVGYAPAVPGLPSTDYPTNYPTRFPPKRSPLGHC